MSNFSRVTGTVSRPADNTAYATGDHIANSTTGSAVVPITFLLPQTRSGRIIGASAVVTPASGSLVITALDFDLLLFRPDGGVAVGAGNYPADNAALPIPASVFREFIGVFSFVNGAWRNPAGALTAGVTGYQAVAPSGRTSYAFSVPENTGYLLGLIQAKGAWTPTGVVNRFDFALDVEA